MDLANVRRTVLGVLQGFGLFRERQLVAQGSEDVPWLLVLGSVDVVRRASAEGGRAEGLRSG